MNESELENIEERWMAATGGPWSSMLDSEVEGMILKACRDCDPGFIPSGNVHVGSDNFGIYAMPRTSVHEFLRKMVRHSDRCGRTSPAPVIPKLFVSSYEITPSADVDFVTHAPTDVGRLLQEARRSRESEENLKAQLRECRESIEGKTKEVQAMKKAIQSCTTSAREVLAIAENL